MRVLGKLLNGPDDVCERENRISSIQAMIPSHYLTNIGVLVMEMPKTFLKTHF